MKTKLLILVMIIFALSGLYASFTLTVEKIELLQTPTLELPCNINAVLNCGSVMKSSYADLLGFPNSILGLIGYSAVLTLGVILLFGAIINRRFFWLANLFNLGAVIFSYFLLYTSVYTIGALCPWCLLSCLSATMIFIALLLYSLKENHFGFSEDRHAKILMFLQKGYFIPIIVIWFTFICVLIYLKYQNALFM